METLTPAKSLVQMTYEAILNEICTGSLTPGTRLSQDHLAAQLNVSRQPVNSAIAMLKSQNFVEDTGRRGVVVAAVDGKLFNEIYQFRAAIDPLAVELAVTRLTKEDIARGREIIARGKACVEAAQSQAVLQADIDFHSLIYQLSGNAIIIDTMHLNWRHLQRSMSKVLQHPGMTTHVWSEHERIFEAMVAGKTAQAAELMRTHARDAPNRISTPDERPAS